MSEPTDILLSVLEKKWPEGIPLREFDDVIRVMMGLADLLAPSRPTKKARATPAVHVDETGATVQPPARIPNAQTKAALREILSDGEGHTSTALALALGRHPVTIATHARNLGATSTRAFTNGPATWRLTTKAKPGPKAAVATPKANRRRTKKRYGSRWSSPSLDFARKQVAKLPRGTLLNAGELSRRWDVGNRVVATALLEAGASKTGTGPLTRWTLPDVRTAVAGRSHGPEESEK